MTTETMSIHRGLSEVKMIEKRLPSLIDNMTLCAIVTQSTSMINGVPINTFKENAIKSVDTVFDLISRRNAIKTAIAQSNAKTKVFLKSMNGLGITVAMAIDLKNNAMKFSQMFVIEMINQYTRIVTAFDNMSEKDRENCDNYLKGIFQNNDTSANAENIEIARKNWMEANSHSIVDPCNLKNMIDACKTRIDLFMAEIDAALSESNAVTMITFSYTNNDKTGLLMLVEEGEDA